MFLAADNAGVERESRKGAEFAERFYFARNPQNIILLSAFRDLRGKKRLASCEPFHSLISEEAIVSELRRVLSSFLPTSFGKPFPHPWS
jgi:hypothetical protein